MSLPKKLLRLCRFTELESCLPLISPSSFVEDEYWLDLRDAIEGKRIRLTVDDGELVGGETAGGEAAGASVGALDVPFVPTPFVAAVAPLVAGVTPAAAVVTASAVPTTPLVVVVVGT